MSISSRLAPHQRVFAAFAIYAFALGNLFPRLPAIKDAMGVQEGALGLALIGTSTGTLISLTLASQIIARLGGHRTALFILLPCMALFFAIAVNATGPVALYFLLIPAGLTMGAIEVIVNVEADRTEAALGRRIMNRAHAFWSFGFFGAGIFGAVMAQLGVPPAIHLAGILPLTILVVWLLLSDFQPGPKRSTETADDTPAIARPTMGIMVLVGVSLSAMLLEGASIDWSAIYMSSVFDAAPFLGGLAVATTALTQAITRYNADRIVDRHAPDTVARIMQVGIMLGIVVVFVAPSPAIALLGFALIGAGTSAIFPLAMSAAAQRSDRAAAVNVAALAQFSFVIFLLGPPLLGFVAEHAGLRWTFGIGLPLVVLSFALSGALGSKPIGDR
ncbi:Predicted arabinose efflux permease, MFS family [Loktanella fryxellensis]|uniref:Predicted arabinose efflux permease, MFS family n=1 Tax=Loktanella fryxellensis TaxID=245187 RepID=A0A1H8DU11_9RHOB|nr:MFS transporter [Loktanella fryxellensis]SEN10656.1 Predicted arabinose efflux permease, MFS family [Loktanella fryxellensis]